jgi:hypothetical protein
MYFRLLVGPPRFELGTSSTPRIGVDYSGAIAAATWRRKTLAMTRFFKHFKRLVTVRISRYLSVNLALRCGHPCGHPSVDGSCNSVGGFRFVRSVRVNRLNGVSFGLLAYVRIMLKHFAAHMPSDGHQRLVRHSSFG